ncbi:MAG TPA: hypothetical protein VJ203_11310 [Bacteroidales bacterium]|nr:hypothetical protein [Bacteroidales bacterium]
MKLNKPANQLNRRNFIQPFGIAASGLVILPASGCGKRITNRSSKNNIPFNPTPHNFRNEPVCLMVPPPEPDGTFIVRLGDIEIPYQVEGINGKKQIWVCSDFASGEKQQFEVVQGNPPEMKKKSDGVRIGDDTIVFNGNQLGSTEVSEVVRISRSGKKILSLSGNEIDLDRWQGEVGLLVPDASDPFGEIQIGWQNKGQGTTSGHHNYNVKEELNFAD